MRASNVALAGYHSPMSGTDNYIIEFTQIGTSIKVTAVDPRSMTEVTIVGGTQYSKEFLTRQVVKKLEYMLAKKRDEGG
jgi:hypothetical protein